MLDNLFNEAKKKSNKEGNKIYIVEDTFMAVIKLLILLIIPLRIIL